MRCSKTTLQFLVIVNNFLFLLLGVGLIVVGCLTEWGSQIIGLEIKRSLETVTLGGPGKAKLKLVFTSLASTAIFAGVIISVVGVLGCIRSLMHNKKQILVVTIPLQMLVTIIAASAYMDVDRIFKFTLKERLRNNYTGRNNTNQTVTAAWNLVFVELKCCGVDNYKDVQASTKWNRNVTINNVNYYLEAPLTCCKNVTGNFPDYTFASGNCGAYPDSENSNFETGCFAVVKDLIIKKINILVAIHSGVIGIEVLFLIVAINLDIQLDKASDVV